MDEMVKQHHRLKDMNLSTLLEIVKDRKSGVLQCMGSQRVGDELATEKQQQQRK